jgi:hypothetical protein
VRALQLLAGRWPLYLLLAVLLFAIQTVMYYTHWVREGELLASLTFFPCAEAIVTVNVGADILNFTDRTGRIVERLWAVIVLDLIAAFVFATSLNALAAGIAGQLFGTAGLVLSMLLLYAVPAACLVEETTTATLVPVAIVTSFQVGTKNLRRMLGLFAIEFALFAVENVGFLWLSARHVKDALFWADAPLEAITAAPIAALVTVAYLYTVAQEPQRPA